MVYKRYIKKDGKTFGPYYYKSERGKDGSVKSVFVSGPEKNKKKNLVCGLLIALIVLGICSIVYTTSTNNILDLSFLKKLTGFSLSDGVLESYDNAGVDLKVIKEEKNPNKVLYFDVGNSKVKLYFDLLDYNGFVSDSEEKEKEKSNLDDEDFNEISENNKLNAEDFDVVVSDQDQGFKWGYKFKLNDLNFLAKIDVSSDEEIKIQGDSLMIGNALIGFDDLRNAGYVVKIGEPTLSIKNELENITEENITEEIGVGLNVIESVNLSGENITIENESLEEVIDNNGSNEVDEENECSGQEDVVDEIIPNEETKEKSIIENINEELGVEENNEEVVSEVSEPDNNEISIKLVTQNIINSLPLFTGRVTQDVDYGYSVSVYLERNFENSEYNIGDVVDLDPTLTIMDEECAEQMDGNACSIGSCCSGNCVDFQTNFDNCGSCGSPCSSAPTNGYGYCSSASCYSGCYSGQTDCSGTCVDTSTDSGNCGGCGSGCYGTTPACSSSTCYDLASDTNNCGSIGNVCGGTTPACCSGSCYDLNNDPGSCGSCGNACSAPTNGYDYCSGGSCSSGCHSGQTDCSGTCYYLDSDTSSCGSCGNVCSSGYGSYPNMYDFCSSGSCNFGCSSGYAECNSNYNDGCEAYTDTDTSNCGSCGTVCGGTTPTCNSGGCLDLDNDVSNCGSVGNSCSGTTPSCCSGSCYDLDSDTSNCGSCGNSCGGTCSSGSCANSCESPLSDCSGTCYNLDTDTSNCGSCSNVCGGTTPYCNVGSCYDLDNDIYNCGSYGNACSGTTPACCSGSCYDLNNDPGSCGSCGNACYTPSGGYSECSGAICSGSGCYSGYSDCSGTCTDTNSDTSNCGSCGSPCDSTPVNGYGYCSSASCYVGCYSGQTDCSGNCYYLDSDTNNCGSCGTVCSGTNPTCNSGGCLDLDNDVSNCGNVGNVCGGGIPSCSGSTCSDLSTDVNNCGNVGVQCSSGNCQMGMCYYSGSFAGGTGSEGDPYQISTCQQLQDIGYYATSGYYFELINDIDCSDTVNWNNGLGFIPIGNNYQFSGYLNGNNYNITNLYINRPSLAYGGLFGYTSSGEIKNIGLINVNISAANYVGGLVGISYLSISNSYSTGVVSGANYVGGLVGVSYSPILNSYSTDSVSGTANFFGGLVGYSSSSISNSYSTGSVSGTASYIGGLVAYSDGSISNSYFTDGNNINDLGTYESGGESAFYGNSYAVYSTWNFSGIWLSHVDGLPTLGVANGCADGQSDCSGYCYDLQTNESNCGSCGNVCNYYGGYNVYDVCSSGYCSYGCSSGYADCNSNINGDGCEVYIDTDVNNCGSCGSGCYGTTPACDAGSCYDLDSDTSNCGSIGNACNYYGGYPNMYDVCSSGSCNFGCSDSYSDCNSDYADGCEMDLDSDTSNCGSCGNVCYDGSHIPGVCSAGSCGYGACESGYDDCDSSGASCEVDLNSDGYNCGSCGTVCSGYGGNSNMNDVCSSGACSFSCLDSYSDCNSDYMDGCEIDLNLDTSNCGSCGTVCSSNGINYVTCTSGVCDGSCDASYYDCNNDKLTDGCEVYESDFNTDTNNCGSCGVVCSEGQICSSGSCINNECYSQDDGTMCSGATGVCCSGSCMVSDSSNCGSCGNVCSGTTPACDGGTCYDLDSEVNHCGSVGNMCPDPANGDPVCSSGTCNVTCDSGWLGDSCDVLANHIPQIEIASNNLYVCEGQALSSFLNVSDSGEDFGSISITPSGVFFFQAGQTLNASKRSYEIYSGTLSKNDAGGLNNVNGSKTYSRNLSISDVAGDSNSTSVNIIVMEINNLPVMESISNQNVVVGNSFTKQILVNDTEDGNSTSGGLDFNITFNSGNAVFGINNSGYMNFAANASILGTYNITVCAIDNGISYAHQNISLCGQTGGARSACRTFLLVVSSSAVVNQPTTDDAGGSGGGGGGSWGFIGNNTNAGEINTEEPEEDQESINIDVGGSAEDRKDLSINCSDWGNCKAVYGVSEVLENRIFFKGQQSRDCVDVKTDRQFEEKKLCDTRAKVIIKKQEDCYKNTLQIFDVNNDLVSRINLDKGNKLNIQFSIDENAYCPYCFDNIKNYDETAVDCGGKCGPCYEKSISTYFNWKLFLFASITLMIVLANVTSSLIVRYLFLRRRISI